MRYQLFILISIIFFLAACKQDKDSICRNQICTLEFRMVSVKFLNRSGEPMIVKDFNAINQRTMKSLVNENNAVLSIQLGSYTVASDNNLRQLSETGDTVLVSARNPADNALKEGKFVIAGGKCACHISKMTGPESIIFD